MDANEQRIAARDRFAAMALLAMLSDQDRSDSLAFDRLAEAAFRVADAMLAARDATPGNGVAP